MPITLTRTSAKENGLLALIVGTPKIFPQASTPSYWNYSISLLTTTLCACQSNIGLSNTSKPKQLHSPNNFKRWQMSNRTCTPEEMERVRAKLEIMTNMIKDVIAMFLPGE